MSVGELIIAAEFALMNQTEGVSERSGSLSKSGTAEFAERRIHRKRRGEAIKL